MELSKKKTLRGIKEYVLITAGIFLYCFSWTGFLIPHGIAGGGVTGLASVIYYASGIPVPVMYFAINVTLLIIGTIIMGKGFGAKTIYSIIVATLFFQILPDLIPWISDVPDKFLNAIIGGSLSGVAVAIIFGQGGSMGGTDIVALIIAKYRETSPGRVFLYCDMIIIGSILFLPDKGFQDMIYGYIQMVMFSFTVDLILTGNKQSIQMFIFSTKYDQIADILMRDFQRGVTVLNGTGWYTKNEANVLIVIARKAQLNEITRVIKDIDDHAFISISQTMSVYGRGFDEIKSGNKIKWKKDKKSNES